MSTLEILGMLPLPVDSGDTQLILMAKFKPVNSGGTLPVHRYLMSPQDPPQQQSTQEQHLPEHLQLATTSPKGSVVHHISYGGRPWLRGLGGCKEPLLVETLCRPFWYASYQDR